MHTQKAPTLSEFALDGVGQELRRHHGAVVAARRVLIVLARVAVASQLMQRLGELGQRCGGELVQLELAIDLCFAFNGAPLALGRPKDEKKTSERANVSYLSGQFVTMNRLGHVLLPVDDAKIDVVAFVLQQHRACAVAETSQTN